MPEDGSSAVRCSLVDERLPEALADLPCVRYGNAAVLQPGVEPGSQALYSERRSNYSRG